jgi:hypothetical protein
VPNLLQTKTALASAVAKMNIKTDKVKGVLSRRMYPNLFLVYHAFHG